jgi:RNA polymerase sigma-70 factor (ECF subfamily)
MTDRELAHAVGRGDQSAVLEFVELYHGGVFRYMRGLVPRREDAEDLAIQTMTQAHQKIRGFRGESSLKTWVHRVGYRQFTHWQRRQQSTRSLPDELVSQPKPFDAVHEADALRDVLLQLPETLRHPFVLHEINDLSVEDVAAILKVPEGTVKSRLHSARAKLRELLTSQEEENHVARTH